jgi:hypothetical protein
MAKNGMALYFAEENFQRDKGVVLKAVEQNGRALWHASSALQGDKDVVLAALKQTNTSVTNGNYDLGPLFYASDELKEDMEFMGSIVEEYSELALKHASSRVQKEFADLQSKKSR